MPPDSTLRNTRLDGENAHTAPAPTLKLRLVLDASTEGPSRPSAPPTTRVLGDRMSFFWVKLSAPTLASSFTELLPSFEEYASTETVAPPIRRHTSSRFWNS